MHGFHVKIDVSSLEGQRTEGSMLPCRRAICRRGCLRAFKLMVTRFIAISPLCSFSFTVQFGWFQFR
jgi:hypothetical protein